METQDQKSVRVPGGLEGAGVNSGMLQTRSDVCWGDGEGFLRRMGHARRCSCNGAGEGWVPWPFSGCAGKSCLDAADQEQAVQAGPCLALHSTRSALVRGEPLNAFKSFVPCTWQLLG